MTTQTQFQPFPQSAATVLVCKRKANIICKLIHFPAPKDSNLYQAEGRRNNGPRKTFNLHMSIFNLTEDKFNGKLGLGHWDLVILWWKYLEFKTSCRFKTSYAKNKEKKNYKSINLLNTHTSITLIMEDFTVVKHCFTNIELPPKKSGHE